MYQITSLGLVVVLAIMITPASIATNSGNEITTFYGYSVMSVKDISGMIVFESGIHNEVLSAGVDFIMDQSFRDGADSDVADADQVDGICIDVSGKAISNLFSPGNETITVNEFNENDGDPTNVNDNCEGVIFTTNPAEDDGLASAISTIAIFNAGGDNLDDGQTIVGIAICGITNSSGQSNCETPLLAMIDTSDITLNTGETVDITYTMTLD